MKRVLLVILPLLLLLSACDRYEHEPFSDVAMEADLMEFLAVLETVEADSLDDIMSWYSKHYLQDKMDKTDVEHLYGAYFTEYGNDLLLSGSFEGYWKSGRVTWTLKGTNPDSTFTIVQNEDYLIMEDNKYVFYGNQVSPPDLDPSKPVVLVQYFTATICGNCPAAATKLEEMHDEYGEQLVVLEYVADSNPGGTYEPEVSYYGGAQPSSMFQGEFLVEGAGEASLADYEARYQQVVNTVPQFIFTDLDFSITGNTITADVSWEIPGAVEGDDLMLQMIVLEENPDLKYIFSPSVYFENRVMAKAETVFDENLTSAEFTLEITIDPEATYSVVVWLQNRPESWTDETGHVYNVIKKVIGE